MHWTTGIKEMMSLVGLHRIIQVVYIHIYIYIDKGKRMETTI